MNPFGMCQLLFETLCKVSQLVSADAYQGSLVPHEYDSVGFLRHMTLKFKRITQENAVTGWAHFILVELRVIKMQHSGRELVLVTHTQVRQFKHSSCNYFHNFSMF